MVCQAEIVLGIEDTHHLIHRLLAHGIQIVSASPDGLRPLLRAFIQPKQIHFRPMGGDFSRSEIVKFKHILNKALLLPVNRAPRTANVHHHPNLFLADLFLVPVRVYMQQPQNPVDRDSQEPYQGGKELGDGGNEPRHPQSQLLRLLHSQPLWYQLSEHQGEIRQNNGNQNHRNGIQRLGRNPNPQTDQPVYQQFREIICGKGAAQKTGQRNGNLDRRQKPGRLHRQLTQPGCLPVTVSCHTLQLGLVHRQHRNFGAGKDGVEANQQNLQQKLP